MHYLHEIKSYGRARASSTSVLDYDRKRIQRPAISSARASSDPAATADLMLLHVHQGEKPAAPPSPPRSSATAREPQAHPPPSAAARGYSTPARSRSSGGESHACRRHTTADRAAQHRAHRRQRVDRCRGGGQCRRRLSSGTMWRVHPTRALDRRAPPSIAPSPNCPERPTRRSSRCRITRRPQSPARSPRAAPADSCASPPGFSELGTEPGLELTRELVDQAGELPFFGPNCYGFVNFFDRAAMLPDQIVGDPIERGVASSARAAPSRSR